MDKYELLEKGNYDLLVNATIFDTNVLLDTLTRLINTMENTRVYLKQFDEFFDTDRSRERKFYKKYIQWQDHCGEVKQAYDLGTYSFYWGYGNHHGENFYERISLADFFPQTKETVEILKNRVFHPGVEGTVLCCICSFDETPYIRDFLEYLINYRLENGLNEISIEQMDEVLTLYIIKYKEHQKILQLKPQD